MGKETARSTRLFWRLSWRSITFSALILPSFLRMALLHLTWLRNQNIDHGHKEPLALLIANRKFRVEYLQWDIIISSVTNQKGTFAVSVPIRRAYNAYGSNALIPLKDTKIAPFWFWKGDMLQKGAIVIKCLWE